MDFFSVWRIVGFLGNYYCFICFFEECFEFLYLGGFFSFFIVFEGNEMFLYFVVVLLILYLFVSCF